ncbi:MAG: hypothetical protein DRH50_09615 [Deltaproteobacteria bacterium]|nr:MAG: hypothetical protein DRH50_09615 [Deltaproteobacteria bacterium]
MDRQISLYGNPFMPYSRGLSRSAWPDLLIRFGFTRYWAAAENRIQLDFFGRFCISILGLDHDSGHCRGGLYALPFRAGINPAPTRQRFLKNGRNDDQRPILIYGK